MNALCTCTFHINVCPPLILTGNLIENHKISMYAQIVIIFSSWENNITNLLTEKETPVCAGILLEYFFESQLRLQNLNYNSEYSKTPKEKERESRVGGNVF